MTKLEKDDVIDKEFENRDMGTWGESRSPMSIKLQEIWSPSTDSSVHLDV